MRKIASEAETLIGNEIHNRDLPLSTFSIHRTPMGAVSPYSQVQSSLKVNYKPIYDVPNAVAARNKVAK